MSELFNVSTGELIEFRKLMTRGPRQFQKATANVLTSFAFGTKASASKVIHDKFTVRNSRFVNSKLRAEKAKASDNINSQRSAAGSISGPRFSGWIEQEEGKTTTRTRVANKFARQNTWSKQMIGRSRLKPNQKFKSPSDFNIKAKNETHRMTVFLIILSRRKRQQSFIISKKFKKFKKGLYRFKSGKIERLQNFEPTKVQPKRIKWLTLGREKFFATANISDIWRGAVNRFFK